jgi:hypothetical protein
MPWWKRLGFGAFVGLAALGGPSLLLLLITAGGGRYQQGRGGVEQDMWLVSLVYPFGAAIGGAIALVFAPFLKHAWQAALIGAIALFPMGLLIGLADNPHGPGAHRLGWGMAVAVAILVGAPAGVLIFRSYIRSPRARHRGDDRESA